MKGNPTARYKIITDTGGNRYQFFCDLSGAHVCTTQPIRADTPGEELTQAWESQGKAEFNHCKKCGKWVSDVMYNADVHECVECAPWQEAPNYCPQCGKKLYGLERFCLSCGAKLLYEGGEDGD